MVMGNNGAYQNSIYVKLSKSKRIDINSLFILHILPQHMQ